jgi:excisionase family DNA binding protein
MKTLLTANQTAEYLNVKLSTIRKWTHYGYIPYVKMRGAVRYDLAKLDAWIEKRSTEGRTRLRKSPFEVPPKVARRDSKKPVSFELD